MPRSPCYALPAVVIAKRILNTTYFVSASHITQLTGLLLVLQGDGGDVAEMESASENLSEWRLRHSLLEYVHMPGHAPGQVVLLHKATSTLLAADVITNLRNGLKWKSVPQLIYPPPCETPYLLPPSQCEHACYSRLHQPQLSLAKKPYYH